METAKPKKSHLALGLMSGSSLDGIDLALCRFELDIREGGFSVPKWEILQAETVPFRENWKERLPALVNASAREYLEAHSAFGKYCGGLINQFLNHNLSTINYNLSTLIGFHGHTLFHHPEEGFTAQLGAGAAVAAATGMTTVSNFRDLDVALGGQGAPVVPIADKYLFPGFDFYLNLGGIANLTAILPGKVIAFDACPVNQVLDTLARDLGKDFDPDGSIASTGWVEEDLLAQMNSEAYYALPYPKSLDNAWSRENLLNLLNQSSISTPDKLRTSVEHITQQIYNGLEKLIETEPFEKTTFRLLATGGGAHNTYLMRRLQEKLETLQIEIDLPSPILIDFKEAALMAFMAVLRMEGLPNVLSSVTGARKDSVSGAVHRGVED